MKAFNNIKKYEKALLVRHTREQKKKTRKIKKHKNKMRISAAAKIKQQTKL